MAFQYTAPFIGTEEFPFAFFARFKLGNFRQLPDAASTQARQD